MQANLKEMNTEKHYRSFILIIHYLDCPSFLGLYDQYYIIWPVDCALFFLQKQLNSGIQDCCAIHYLLCKYLLMPTDTHDRNLDPP